MSHDLVELNVMVVSDSGSDRAALKTACADASVVINVREFDSSQGVSLACRSLAEENIDVVFLDCRIALASRQTVIEVARASQAQPLVISIGFESSATAPDTLRTDGVIAEPIEAAEARTLLNSCVRARLPNRILIVDDSTTVRAVIRKVLQSCRYRFEVEEASDGSAALEQAGRQRFDLVLLDCHMPGVDGFATLTIFRQKHADTKVVMMTATNDLKLGERARGEGAYDVLYKPFYDKDIDAVMDRICGLAQPKR